MLQPRPYWVSAILPFILMYRESKKITKGHPDGETEVSELQTRGLAIPSQYSEPPVATPFSL